jgi:hypothetical protein
MAKPQESSKAAIVVATLLLIPLLISGSYVAGYFVCSNSRPSATKRFFASKQQYWLFAPLVRLEEAMGRKVNYGYIWE